VEIDELGTRAKLEQLPFEVRWPAQRAIAMWEAGDVAGAKAQLDVAHAACVELDDTFGRFHVQHLRACVAFSERDYDLSRRLHNEVLGMCHEIGFLGGMGSSLCDLAMIDLAEGDPEGAFVRYERGLACYEEGGYIAHAERARAWWESTGIAS
jgi:hypothetical protein